MEIFLVFRDLGRTLTVGYSHTRLFTYLLIYLLVYLLTCLLALFLRHLLDQVINKPISLTLVGNLLLLIIEELELLDRTK